MGLQTCSSAYGALQICFMIMIMIIYMTKIPNFENSRRRLAAILKMVLSL